MHPTVYPTEREFSIELRVATLRAMLRVDKARSIWKRWDKDLWALPAGLTGGMATEIIDRQRRISWDILQRIAPHPRRPVP